MDRSCRITRMRKPSGAFDESVGPFSAAKTWSVVSASVVSVMWHNRVGALALRGYSPIDCTLKNLCQGDGFMIGLRGRVAVISGCSLGIGRATAIRLAEADANIVINDLASPDAILGLASPLSDIVQGVTLTIDGGLAIHV